MEGDYSEAIKHFDAALSIYESLGSSESIQADHTRIFRGGALLLSGKIDEATSELEESVSSYLAKAGDRNFIAEKLNALGAAHFQNGNWDKAGELFLEALSLAQSSDETVVRLSILTNIAVLKERVGPLEEAATYAESALDEKRALYGDTNPLVVTSLLTLGVIEHDLGANDKARAYFEEADTLIRAAVGEDNPIVGAVQDGLGLVALADGRLDDAEALFRQSVSTLRRTLDAGSPLVSFPLCGLGEVALARQRFKNARGFFTEAISLQTGHADPQVLARAQIGLAKALFGLDRRTAESASLLSEALRFYREYPVRYVREITSTELWARDVGISVSPDEG